MSIPSSTARRARPALGLCAPLAALLLLAAPAQAETAAPPMQELTELQAQAAAAGRDRRALQTQLAQASGLTTAQAAEFERRLSGLERELRGLTGRLEDLDFRIRQQQQRLDRFESETKARLLRLEQGQPAPAETPSATYTPPGDTQGETASGRGTSGGQVAGADGGGQPGPLQPRSLGTIPDQGTAGGQQGGQARGGQTQGGQPGQDRQQALAPTPELPEGDPQAAYDTAFDLLRRMDYPAAEAAFSQYLELYPDSDLAGNAKYWLGETHYVRGDYETSAVVFAEGYQDFPDSSKAPDNLLKLGMSLANLGATQDACATFAELQRRYPDAAPTILQRAQRESGRLGC